MAPPLPFAFLSLPAPLPCLLEGQAPEIDSQTEGKSSGDIDEDIGKRNKHRLAELRVHKLNGEQRAPDFLAPTQGEGAKRKGRSGCSNRPLIPAITPTTERHTVRLILHEGCKATIQGMSGNDTGGSPGMRGSPLEPGGRRADLLEQESKVILPLTGPPVLANFYPHHALERRFERAV